MIEQLNIWLLKYWFCIITARQTFGKTIDTPVKILSLEEIKKWIESTTKEELLERVNNLIKQEEYFNEADKDRENFYKQFL